MFADPLSVAPVTAVTAGTALSFNKTSNGLYLLSTSTLDEPITLSINNTIDPTGTSSFVAKYSVTKNAPGTPAYGQKTLPDDVSSVHMVVRHCHRAHTLAQIANFRDLLIGFVRTDALWDKFLRGEM